MSKSMQNHGTECKVSVKSGNLATRGQGTMAITHTADGQYWVKVLLPGETGAPESLDLTSIERVELVKTKTGWFQKGQWIKPLVATAGAVIGVPAVFSLLIDKLEITSVLLFPLVEGMGISESMGQLLGLTWLGATYTAGVYTGTQLTRLARFVVTTQDGKHAVLEGPESAFRFMSGIYAAPNITLDPMETEIPSVPSGDPTPAAA